MSDAAIGDEGHFTAALDGDLTAGQLPGVALWIDMLDPTAYTLGDTNTTVATWKNKISGGSASQGTSANRAAFSATGLNGHPCMDPDGSNDFYNVTGGGVAPIGSTGSLTIFAVASIPTSGSQGKILSWDSSLTQGDFGVGLSSGSHRVATFSQADDGSGASTKTANAAHDANPHVYCWIRDESEGPGGTGTISFEFDGVNVGSASPTYPIPTRTTNEYTLFAGHPSSFQNFFAGTLGELVVCTGIVPSPTRAKFALAQIKKWLS